MPGTIKIGNEGFRATIKTDSNNNLVLNTLSTGGQVKINDALQVTPTEVTFASGSTTVTASVDVTSGQLKFSKSDGTYVAFKGSEVETRDTSLTVKTRVVEGGKEYVRSGSATDNQIEMEQTTAGAFISVSGSNPGFNIKKTSSSQYSLWRGGSLHFVDGVMWTAGLNSDGNFTIEDSIASTTTPEFMVKPNGGVLSGSWDVDGNVTVDGTISATRKSFDIPHPIKPDKRLVYGSLEGPEFGVYIRGKIENDNKIPIPDYWSELVDFDTLSVHLTQINSKEPIYFTFSDGTYIYINERFTFFYFICAERKDIDKLEVEQ